MIKKVALAILATCLLLPGAAPAAAGSGLAMLDSTVKADFPDRLTFGLTAESDTDIVDVRLHYRVERMAHADVTSEVYLEFAPAATVTVDWDWEMMKTGGLPSGTGVEYWWTLADAAGRRAATEPAVVRFDDERYDWQSLSRGSITLYWYQGGDSFIEELMAAAQQALVRLEAGTGAVPERPVSIYIYGSYSDLLGAMIYPQEWTGGAAFTRYSTIAIGIPTSQLEWGCRAMAHELCHLVVHQVVFNPYGGMPTWLDEGLAMNAEGEMSAAYAKFLHDAVAGDSLISVRSLASPFSAYAEESYLAYAQSYSIVKFLTDTYGEDGMFALLRAFGEGSTYDGALLSVYGFDMDGLDALWRDYAAASGL